MYCSTCGALVPVGRTACVTCGATVASAPQPLTIGRPRPINQTWAPTGFQAARPASVATCPRCGYRGEGIGYFSRGRNLAKLILAAMFTSFAMGAGAVVYYVLRRDFRVCPNCAKAWEPRGELGVPGITISTPASSPQLAPSYAESARPGWSIIFFLLAAIFAVGGIAGGDTRPLIFAGLAAAAGLLLHHRAESERERRRAALIASLQLPVLQLAASRGGRLTVTEVAAQLGWTLPRAEKVLNSLDDGYRVSSDVTDEGLIIYEFRELRYGSLEHSDRSYPTKSVTGGTARPPGERL